jgi:hypothetical protein
MLEGITELVQFARRHRQSPSDFSPFGAGAFDLFDDGNRVLRGDSAIWGN